MASGTDMNKALRRVIGAFNDVQGLDESALRSVLELMGGDANRAIDFLTARNTTDWLAQSGGGGRWNNPIHTSDGVPEGYMARPEGHKGSMTYEASREEAVSRDRMAQLKALFLRESTLTEHHDAQHHLYPHYTSVLLLLIDQGVEFSASTKARVLASALARRDKELCHYLLMREKSGFGFVELVKALTLLDSARRVRALEKRIVRLSRGNVRAGTLAKLQNSINELRRESTLGSVSGALTRFVRTWVRSIPCEALQFYALHFPLESWRALADMCHLASTDFTLPWFLGMCFGDQAPEGSMVAQCSDLNQENVRDRVLKHDVPYSFLRKRVDPTNLPNDVKARVALYEKLDTVIWYYEELRCTEVDMRILNRLEDGEEAQLSYGKLMERLLYFKRVRAPFFDQLSPIAERRLKEVSLPLEPPVVILGDASYSMDVAIRTATIISSLLTALTQAELLFFNTEVVRPSIVPRTIPEVLELASNTRASGMTAPAAALWEYYSSKQKIRFFIIVTDEIENVKSHDTYFAQLFWRYRQEVYPARIVFVSFLENIHEKGRMVSALEALGIVPLQFRLDAQRPDLRRLDALLGMLASEASFFATNADELAHRLQDMGLAHAVENLRRQMAGLPSQASQPSQAEAEGSNAPSASGQVTVVHVHSETERCVICLERPRDTALLDCGHLSFCAPCAESLPECPICRSCIKRRVRIFKS